MGWDASRSRRTVVRWDPMLNDYCSILPRNLMDEFARDASHQVVLKHNVKTVGRAIQKAWKVSAACDVALKRKRAFRLTSTASSLVASDSCSREGVSTEDQSCSKHSKRAKLCPFPKKIEEEPTESKMNWTRLLCIFMGAWTSG